MKSTRDLNECDLSPKMDNPGEEYICECYKLDNFGQIPLATKDHCSSRRQCGVTIQYEG